MIRDSDISMRTSPSSSRWTGSRRCSTSCRAARRRTSCSTPISCCLTRRGGTSRREPSTTGERLDGWYPAEYWDDEPWLVLQGYQRYLLQVGFVDTLVGRVLRTLDEAGIYDRSLIVVARTTV